MFLDVGYSVGYSEGMNRQGEVAATRAELRRARQAGDSRPDDVIVAEIVDGYGDERQAAIDSWKWRRFVREVGR